MINSTTTTQALAGDTVLAVALLKYLFIHQYCWCNICKSTCLKGIYQVVTHTCQMKHVYNRSFFIRKWLCSRAIVTVLVYSCRHTACVFFCAALVCPEQPELFKPVGRANNLSWKPEPGQQNSPRRSRNWANRQLRPAPNRDLISLFIYSSQSQCLAKGQSSRCLYRGAMLDVSQRSGSPRLNQQTQGDPCPPNGLVCLRWCSFRWLATPLLIRLGLSRQFSALAPCLCFGSVTASLTDLEDLLQCFHACLSGDSAMCAENIYNTTLSLSPRGYGLNFV